MGVQITWYRMGQRSTRQPVPRHPRGHGDCRGISVLFLQSRPAGKKRQAGMRLRCLLGNNRVFRIVRRPETGWYRQSGSILCGMHRTRESELT